MLKRTLLAALLAVPACTDMAENPATDTATSTEDLTAAPAQQQPPPPPAQSWRPLVNQPSFAAGIALQLTDGTIMVQDVGSPNWWRLTPDASGSYANGTWSQLPSLPEGYSPLYFASAVLPDGRVLVEGGEYNDFNPAWTNDGAIYDPIANTWTRVAPPAGWNTIGDAQSVVLATGQLMLANALTTEAALFDPKTLTWTPTGTGKEDRNDEEGWTLLPDGTVLTVDANNLVKANESELYVPARRSKPAQWQSAGDTKVALADLDPDGGGSHELGPAVLRADGTVIAFGATGHNAVYDTRSKSWASAPDFPIVDAEGGQLDVADGPAALMPNGNVLVATSPTVFNVPTHFFEFDGQEMTEVAAPPNAANNSSYNQTLLVLPTGELLLTDFSSDVEIYTPAQAKGCQHDLAPEIDSVPGALRPGQSYALRGERLNGVSQAVGYGDDAQAATNYPLVRITNRKTGHVVFARTHDHSSMAIGRDTDGSTHFDVPATAERGKSELVVIANGIASEPVAVDVK